LNVILSDALLAQVSALQEMGFPEAASKVAVMRYPHQKKKAVEHLLGVQILQTETDEAKKLEEFPENKQAMQYRRFCENILEAKHLWSCLHCLYHKCKRQRKLAVVVSCRVTSN
jgi:hypothetical protein